MNNGMPACKNAFILKIAATLSMRLYNIYFRVAAAPAQKHPGILSVRSPLIDDKIYEAVSLQNIVVLLYNHRTKYRQSEVDPYLVML
jgi:hypothetical protein